MMVLSFGGSDPRRPRKRHHLSPVQSLPEGISAWMFLTFATGEQTLCRTHLLGERALVAGQPA